LVVALRLMPLLMVSPALTDGALWMVLIAVLTFLAWIVILAWLIGATHAKVDTLDVY